MLQAKEGVARPTAFQRSDLRRCGLPAEVPSGFWPGVVSYVLAARRKTPIGPQPLSHKVSQQTTFRPKPDVANSSGHSESYDGVKVKPSSIQPVTPPIIIFTGKPSRARRNAALLAPLQCGPAQ